MYTDTYSNNFICVCLFSGQYACIYMFLTSSTVGLEAVAQQYQQVRPAPTSWFRKSFSSERRLLGGVADPVAAARSSQGGPGELVVPGGRTWKQQNDGPWQGNIGANWEIGGAEK